MDLISKFHSGSEDLHINNKSKVEHAKGKGWQVQMLLFFR